MKLSKGPKDDHLIAPQSWKCYDGCPACEFMRKAAEEGREVTAEEIDKAFAEARKQSEV